MRIALCGTFPPMRCAVGRYARRLAEALLGEDPSIQVVVAAEMGAEAAQGARLRVVPCYRRAEDYGDAVLGVVREAAADLVHFQHAPDLLGEDERLPRLCRRLG